MKKLLFVVSIVLVFASCGIIIGCDIEEQKPGVSTIKNTSANFDVSYQFKDEIERIIAKESEDSFERPLYDYIKLYEPSKRVLLNTQYPHKNDVIYTFSERQSYAVKVINTTAENITLSADGWMEKINLSDISTEQSDPTWLVYTDKPNFNATSSSGYPVNASYNLSENIFKIVISLGG